MTSDERYTEYVTGRLEWLHKIAFLLCQDWAHAEDLVQITITRLYVHWRRASKVDNLDGYTRTILMRVFLAEQRTGWRKWVTARRPPPDTPTAPVDPDMGLDLRAALLALAPRQRASVVLRFYCDLSVEQTAEILGCSPGTIKSQTARALMTLRHDLRRSPLKERLA
ncbi:SigE family RNA polymerase sigma factor [Actinoallomurus vinaceus]|uniref:SigE family RNA polymerase sigma factor n=1 Tax=Actinoallomurus vinaceus TaxID=1080074 RepID=A0ABP8UQS3_9ACTN